MAYVIIYLVAIVAANLSVAYFGPASMPINAFLLIGLDLSLRDKLHEAWRGKLLTKMGALIAAGGIITYLLNADAGQIALASCLAFAVAALADTLVYHTLIGRRFLVKANASNVVGAAVDSVLFPTLAFGVFLPWAIAGQFLAKAFGGAVWAYLLKRFRLVVAVMLLFVVADASAQNLFVSSHYDINRQSVIAGANYTTPLPLGIFAAGFLETWHNPKDHGFPQGWVWYSKHWFSRQLVGRLSISTELEFGYNFPGSWSRWPVTVGFVPDKPQAEVKIGLQYRLF